MTREELGQILERTGFTNKIVSMPKWNSSFLNINGRSFGEMMVVELCKTLQKERGIKYAIVVKRFHKNTANYSSQSCSMAFQCVKDVDTFLECLRDRDIRMANEEELSCIYKKRKEYASKQIRKNRNMNIYEMGQMYYEEHYGTREEFIEEFGKSYL